MRDEKTALNFSARMKLLWYIYKLAYRQLPGYPCAILLSNLFTAAQPMVILFFSSRVINELTGGRNVRHLALYVGAAVGCSVVLTACKAILFRKREMLGGWIQLVGQSRRVLSEQFSTMDFAYTEDSTIAEALARMDVLSRGTGKGLMNLCYFTSWSMENLFTLLFSIPLLVGIPITEHGLGWAVLPLLAAILAGTLFFQRVQDRRELAGTAANARANTVARFYSKYIEPDQAAKDIRLYNQASTLLELFRKGFGTGDELAYYRLGGHADGYSMAAVSLIGGIVYLLVGNAALAGAVEVGSVVQGVGAATALFGAVGSLLSALSALYRNIPYLLPLRDFLEMPDLLQKGTRPVPARAAVDYTIEFRNVSFRYPGAEEYALRDLNLTLTPGRRLAVVGRNGSGKTTMIKLLCRLYDPTEGAILLDGVNIKEYDHGQYTALFSAVFQDYVLFPLSLGQNVAAAAQYDAARAADCLTRAGFGGRLGTMPQGLDTMLYKSYDESGVQISGGEAQKIALARALYKNAPFVVLDEPTAALDPQAEYEVYTTFNQTIGDKTAIFISHRLSSCRFADEIAVFEDGKMVQHGGHGQLLGDASGQYCALWNAQAQYYTAKEGA